jgi:hypothetical protein
VFLHINEARASLGDVTENKGVHRGLGTNLPYPAHHISNIRRYFQKWVNLPLKGAKSGNFRNRLTKLPRVDNEEGGM